MPCSSFSCSSEHVDQAEFVGAWFKGASVPQLTKQHVRQFLAFGFFHRFFHEVDEARQKAVECEGSGRFQGQAFFLLCNFVSCQVGTRPPTGVCGSREYLDSPARLQQNWAVFSTGEGKLAYRFRVA